MPEPLEFAELGVQLSRGFRALKVWMSLQAHGVAKIGRVIEQNVAQARLLVELIDADPRLELMPPAPLNVVCFRYLPPGGDGPAVDALNREILLRLQEDGIAIPSSTWRGGRSPRGWRSRTTGRGASTSRRWSRPCSSEENACRERSPPVAG